MSMKGIGRKTCVYRTRDRMYVRFVRQFVSILLLLLTFVFHITFGLVQVICLSRKVKMNLKNGEIFPVLCNV